MAEREAEIRCYAELNGYLPRARRHKAFPHRFRGSPSVGETLANLGIPPDQVELAVLNGRSVGLEQTLAAGDRLALFPVFETLDVTPLARLREQPLRRSAFVLDVHLGKLARLLRMLGFDALHRERWEDEELVALAVAERRILLTRDRALMAHPALTHAYRVQSVIPDDQIAEVLARLHLHGQIAPFTRCMACNGLLEPAAKEAVWAVLPESVRREHEEFFRCPECGKVYWKGSHYRNMTARVQRLQSGE